MDTMENTSLLTWLLLGILLVLLVVRRRRRRREEQGVPRMRATAPLEKLVGRVIVLPEALPQGAGRMHIGEHAYRMRAEVPLAAGSSVKIVAVDGSVLVVRPVYESTAERG
jgi:membrane protein implicated in regulation of membrane protease activity